MQKDERIKKDIEHLERCEHLGIDHALGQESLDRIDLYHELQKATARIKELEECWNQEVQLHLKATERIAELEESKDVLVKSYQALLIRESNSADYALKIGKERDQLKLDLENKNSDYENLWKKTLELKAELAEAEKVIEFYGNRDSWVGPENKYQIIATHDCDTHGGKIAREYLAKEKK